MKAQRTLVFAILFLTTLAWGLVSAQAAPATPQAGLQATPVSTPFTNLAAGRTGSGLECVSFCSIAYCPQGTTCGPTPSGGCGCNPDGGGVLGSDS